jgi:hypothetical protein
MKQVFTLFAIILRLFLQHLLNRVRSAVNSQTHQAKGWHLQQLLFLKRKTQ